MSRRCALLIVDAGPINSLWVAGRLDLLQKMQMPVIMVDEVLYELTSDPEHYQKDRDVDTFVKENLAENGGIFRIEKTFVGSSAKMRRAANERVPKNLGEAAIVEFLDAEEPDYGVNKYLNKDDAILLLFEDSDVKSVKIVRSDNVHLLSTVAMLKGLEACDIIDSAEAIIDKMLHPDNSRIARRLTGLPDGVDDPARIGSSWKPR